MSGSTLAVIVIPVVIAVALAGWLYAVFHADRHPEIGNSNTPPDRAVTGGIFRRERRPSADAPAGKRPRPARRHDTPNGN